MKFRSAVIAILMVFTTFSYLFYCIGNKLIVLNAIKEDGFFEYLTAICFLASSIVCLACYKKKSNILFVLLALLMFFGAGEEISWGQRIIGFATPQTIKANNVQGEFTLHNLSAFNGKQFSGTERHSGLSRLIEMDNLFKLFIFSFGIILPLLFFNFRSIRKLTVKYKIPVPPISIGAFFALSWLGRKIVLSVLQKPTGSKEQLRAYWSLFNGASEIYECIDALTLLAIFVYFLYSYKSKPALSNTYVSQGKILMAYHK